jgi:threonine dehydrogenase-like Zn-dependent dehydrogenase
MKAVVWQASGQIDLQEVPDARIEQPGDAVVRLTMSAICGTDLHMVRGTMPDMVPGTVIPSTICCGTYSYCRAAYMSQCDKANPDGPAAGTSFFGGPRATGPINSLQAAFARVPFAAASPAG